MTGNDLLPVTVLKRKAVVYVRQSTPGHQIDRVEVAAPGAGAHNIGGDGDGQMGLSCACAADQDDIAPCGQERAAVQ